MATPSRLSSLAAGHHTQLLVVAMLPGLLQALLDAVGSAEVDKCQPESAQRDPELQPASAGGTPSRTMQREPALCASHYHQRQQQHPATCAPCAAAFARCPPVGAAGAAGVPPSALGNHHSCHHSTSVGGSGTGQCPVPTGRGEAVGTKQESSVCTCVGMWPMLARLMTLRARDLRGHGTSGHHHIHPPHLKVQRACVQHACLCHCVQEGAVV